MAKTPQQTPPLSQIFMADSPFFYMELEDSRAGYRYHQTITGTSARSQRQNGHN